jgi:hypothetical protein
MSKRSTGRLPHPIAIPSVMTLKKLADVRNLTSHLPAETRGKPTWQHVEAASTAAAGWQDIWRD